MANNNDKCLILFKMGSKEHMEDLLYNGTIYMNSTEFFKNEDKNSEIGDKFEGVCSINNGNRAYRRDLDYEKLYCMWHINNINSIPTEILHEDITYDDETHWATVKIDFKKYDNFTKVENDNSKEIKLYIVIIKDIKEFNKRIIKKCNELRLVMNRNKVTYYDESKDCSNITPFMKRIKYSKQLEMRYLINHKNKNH